ncbi:MAG: Rpn family recombination-promoting nuclease/putative transposase [Planctomycetia bacterium]|nr:Rpn family recombination-promoting nuclease/putative transposase [Planctomycetia bacterium]
MSEKDVVERMITSKPTIVADLINFTIFGNEEVVSASELEIIPTHQSFVDSDGQLRSLLRDSAAKWKRNGVVFAFLGVESQTSIDPDMPLRVIGYDGASYREQLNNPKAVRYPVVTLVLYYGREPWTKYLSLKERLNLPSEYAEKLGVYLSDYKINVIDIRRLTLEDIRKLRSDFAFIATVCYQVDHPSAIIEYPAVQDIPLVVQFLQAFCGIEIEPVNLEKLLKQGGDNMDQIVTDFRNLMFNQFREKALEEGRAEERQNREQMQMNYARKMALQGKTSYEIADFLDVPQATVETWLDGQC